VAGEEARATLGERWYQRLLHNETALAIQKRLQWAGRTMVLMPIRVRP
jgi:hypothetical protein